jgi:hypothetical protein
VSSHHFSTSQKPRHPGRDTITQRIIIFNLVRFKCLYRIGYRFSTGGAGVVTPEPFGYAGFVVVMRAGKLLDHPAHFFLTDGAVFFSLDVLGKDVR